jgi:drug/metabolite transporter (DMT)-like permease
VGALIVAAGTQFAGLVLVAVALAVVRPEMPDVIDLVPALAGGLAGGLGLVALFRALAIGQMGITAPIAGTGVAIPILASFVMGELPNAYQAAGVVIALAGVFVATSAFHDGAAPTARRAQGIGFAVLAAAMFGLFYVGLAAGGEDSVLWTVVAARVLSVAVLVAWAGLRWSGRLAWPTAARRRIVASGTLDVTGNAIFTLATTQGLLVLAAVPAALYPLVTLLCARVVLGEQLDRIQRVGAVLALAGVALMAVPG